jgi:hypothetical protein
VSDDRYGARVTIGAVVVVGFFGTVPEPSLSGWQTIRCKGRTAVAK